MIRKLRTEQGRQCYTLRMVTVEPVFGQIKQARGFRQFLLRGLEKVDWEWSLICTGHNPESSSKQALLKLFRFGRPQSSKARGKAPARKVEKSPTGLGAMLQRLSARLNQ